METDTIYNMDCLEGMKLIPDGSYRKITDKDTALEAFAKLVEFEKRQTFLKL